MTVFYILMSGLLSGMPLIGGILAGLWMPFGSLLLVYGAKDVLDGKMPTYETLVKTFRKPQLRGRLATLGLIYAVGLQFAIWVFLYLGRDAFKVMETSDNLADFNMPMGAFGVATAIYLVVLLLTLFSPVLQADAGQKLNKSLFSSFLGILLQWRACLTAGIAYLVLGMILVTILFEAFQLLGIGRYFFYITPFYLTFITGVGYAMIWPMYRDIYGAKNGFEKQP